MAGDSARIPGHRQAFLTIKIVTPDTQLRSLRQRAVQARVARVRLAREDPNTFAQFVMRDEETGSPIRQAPTHIAWHDLASTYRNLLVWSHVEAGKTIQLSVTRPLWELGRDPTLRVAILSNTSGQAVKIGRLIAKYIEESEELHAVFPDLVPDPDPKSPWNTTNLTVKRKTRSKDPSIQILGVHGNVLGSRIDLLIVDDILDRENTLTPKARNDLWSWYQATVVGRLSSRSRVIVVGNAWHPGSTQDPGDLMHRLARMAGWKAVRYPVMDERGAPRWPERWPTERIDYRRGEMIPEEFARQMMCVARDDSSSRFRAEWIERCLRNGDGLKLAWGFDAAKVPGCRTYTGVDLGVGHQKSDLTCLFHIAVMPDESRRILGVESGRWQAPEVRDRIIDAHRRYDSILVVENNGFQDFLVQLIRSSTAIPIIAFTTGRNKADPNFGIESMAVELANGKWIIPNEERRPHKEIEAWISELLYYDPNSHAGDRLMASWFATWGARKGGSAGGPTIESGPLDTLRR